VTAFAVAAALARVVIIRTVDSAPAGARGHCRELMPAARIGLRRPGRVGHSGGHGLGLAIVRAIAGVRGATVTANARPEGGLDIQLSFPLSPAKVPTGEHEPSANRRART